MKTCSECCRWKNGWCTRKQATADKDSKPCKHGEAKCTMKPKECER